MKDLKQTPPENIKPSGFDKLYPVLQIVAVVLLVAGFAGPWLYGPLGKSKDFGWQPVWAILLNLVSLNVFILLTAVNCFSYLELYVREAKPVLAGALRWIGAFLLLVIVVPLAAWLPTNQTQRSPTPQFSENTFGWGIWVALAGLVLQVVALRLKIRQVKRTRPDYPAQKLPS